MRKKKKRQNSTKIQLTLRLEKYGIFCKTHLKRIFFLAKLGISYLNTHPL